MHVYLTQQYGVNNNEQLLKENHNTCYDNNKSKIQQMFYSSNI